MLIFGDTVALQRMGERNFGTRYFHFRRYMKNAGAGIAKYRLAGSFPARMA
jgi:hypothetical protein